MNSFSMGHIAALFFQMNADACEESKKSWYMQHKYLMNMEIVSVLFKYSSSVRVSLS